MTPTKSSADKASSTSTVQDLLEQRSQIQRWLTNLDTVGTDANSRVVERVRIDYSDRLDVVIEELAEHLETIRADRDERQQQLEAATQRLQSVSEEMEEARLRHMIGEISDEAWLDRQPELGDAVTEAEADREDARAEVARLDELLRQIEEDQNAEAEATSTSTGDENGPADEEEEHTSFTSAEEWESSGVEDEDAADLIAFQDEVVGGGLDGLGSEDDDSAAPEAKFEEAQAGSGTGDSEGADATDDSDDLVYLSPESDVEKSMSDLDAVGAVDTPPADAATTDISFGDLAAVPDSDSDSDLEIYRGPLDPLAFLTELPGTDEATVEQPSSQSDDFEFLKQLDRAIGGSDEAASTESAVNSEEASEQFRPTPGTKCPECGYTNDPEAWYCGVCGVDLA
ncbi:hypothetical protein BH23GEM8_BH23GEM8_19190 [soil metagenome]